MLQGKTRHLCNDSSKKSCFCRGAKRVIYMQYMRLSLKLLCRMMHGIRMMSSQKKCGSAFSFTKIKISFTDADLHL